MTASDLDARAPSHYALAITASVKVATSRCRQLPPGYRLTDVGPIVSILAEILIEINCTLKALLTLHGISSYNPLLRANRWRLIIE